MDSSVRLSAEQRTKIRETVLSRSDVPRVDRVNFSLSVGTVVPTHVRVVEVPPALIDIHPEWRGHLYFVVEDEIIIVDRDHRIMATLPVGSSSAQRDGSFAREDARGSLTLSQEEIRQVQIILKQKGFDIVVDGVLGPKSKQALVAFQRREGIQASGQIDSRTVTALGLSDKIGGQAGRRGGDTSTMGQGDRMRQSPDQDRGAAQQDQGQDQPATTGQGGDRSQQQPSAKPDAGGQSDTDASRQPARQAPQSDKGGRVPMEGGQSK